MSENPRYESCEDCPRCRWEAGVARAAAGEICVLCHQEFNNPGEAPQSGSGVCWRCRPPGDTDITVFTAQWASQGQQSIQDAEGKTA